MAELVMNGRSAARLPSFSSMPSESVQRDGDEKPQASKPDNYDEAAQKIGDALQETSIGKQLKAKAGELGDEFLSSVEGKVIAGTALSGALATIIATNSKLPVPIPEIPLDFIKPGLKAKLTYEGPAQKPTHVGLTLTSKNGVSVSAGYTQTAAAQGKPAEEKAGLTLTIPLGGSPAKPESKGSDSDKYRAGTARMAAEQRKFTEGMKTPAQKAQDKADEQTFLNSYLRNRTNDPLSPLDPGRKKDDPMLMRKATASSVDAGAAPPIVHEVLAGSGHLLDSDTRAFMEDRFGHDFSRVRIHTDVKAAESARDVDAHAYTVGSSIVFDTGQFAPMTRTGRHLLAHELAHVVQQDGAPDFAVQRACRSAAQCAAPSAGNAAQFGVTVEAESEANAVASGGAVGANGHATCLLPRHGQRATNFETLATTAGLGATIAPGIDGFFINACLSANDGASNAPCPDFPGGAPAHTDPAHFCVQLHTTDEDLAIRLRAQPRPLGDADLRNFLWITSSVAHESQHNRFDANAATIVPPAADCNVNTPVPIAHGAPVESLLSEISAEIAEFDVYFRNSTSNPSRSSTFAMQSEEHDIAIRNGQNAPGGGENILGNIKDMQCVCACATVDRFVENVFAQASSAWTPAERAEFKKGMTDFIPGFWPRSLQQRR